MYVFGFLSVLFVAHGGVGMGDYEARVLFLVLSSIGLVFIATAFTSVYFLRQKNLKKVA